MHEYMGKVEFKENGSVNGKHEQELAKSFLIIGYFTSEVHRTV